MLLGRIAPWFRNVDPHVLAGVASLGLATGSWAAAAYGLVQLLAEPQYLVALYHAIVDARTQHLNDYDIFAIAQLVGALVALFGTAVIAMALALYGRIGRSPVPADGGALPPPTKGPSS